MAQELETYRAKQEERRQLVLARQDHSAASADLTQRAEDYVATHPELFTIFEGASRAQCVAMEQQFRDSGMVDQATLAAMWLRARYEPVKIGGRVNAEVERASFGALRGRKGGN